MNNHPTKKRRKETNGNMNAIRSSKRRSTANSNDGEYCELPFTLSSILIDEFDCITAGGGGRQTTNASTMLKRSVHVLPSKITVRQVLEHYRRKRSNISSHGGENQIERDRFCDGLALLFDEALPVCLLYREERTQYENLQNDESLRLKRPCEIYGSTFLLRLFKRLPTLLCSESKKEMDQIGPFLGDLVVLLQKNRSTCFKETYRLPNEHELLSWENMNPASNHNKNKNDNNSEQLSNNPSGVSYPKLSPNHLGEDNLRHIFTI